MPQFMSACSNSLGFSWSDMASAPAVLDYAISSTTTYKFAMSVVLKESEVPDTAYIYLTADNTADISVEWQTNDPANVRPSGSKVTNSNTVTVTAPTAGVMTITGLKGTATGTAGQILWLVFNTPSGTPTGSLRATAAKCVEQRITGYRTSSMRATYTTSWGGTTYSHLGLMVLYSSGKTDGYVVSDCTTTTDKVYGTDEDGCRFTSPDCWLSASGIAGNFKRTGTTFSPLFVLRMRLNGVIYDTAVVGDYGVLSTTTAISLAMPFVDAIPIPPKSDVVLTAVNSGGSSSNYLYLTRLVVPATVGSVNTNSIRPFDGTFRRAAYLSSAWTYTDTELPFMSLVLNQSKGILPAPLDRRQFNAMR